MVAHLGGRPHIFPWVWDPMICPTRVYQLCTHIALTTVHQLLDRTQWGRAYNIRLTETHRKCMLKGLHCVL